MKKKLLDEQLVWVLSFLKPYLFGLLGVLVLTFGQNYSVAMLPTVSTKFLWELITPEKIHLLYRYFYIAIGLIFARALFNFLQRYSMRLITLSAIKKVRDTFFGHLLTLDIDYFRKNNTGNIISIGINDIEMIRTNMYQGITNFISNVMMLVIVLVKLFNLNWRLTVISFSVMPVLYIVVRVIGNKMKIISRKLRKNIADLSINLHETVTGMEVVKSFAQESYENEVFRKNTKRYKRTFLKLVRLEMIFSPLNDVIIYLYGLMLVGVGAFYIINGGWSARGLTEYLMLLGILSGPILKMPNFVSHYKTVQASIERVYNIISIEPKINEIENPVKRVIGGEVEFRNVLFAYEPGVEVLKNVSFTVNKGERLALVGPSGAGKTTIINLIPRHYDCDRGEILIDDVNVKDYSLKSLRSQIGMVSQNVILFNTTILENIKYAKREATKEEIIQAAKKAYAYDFIMELPYQFETSVGEKGVRLSGGQKQRISIARTILMNPQILILDEATSALDSESEHYIQMAINNLMEGRTSIIIAHRLSTIKHATKILVIDKGKIVAHGTHEKLLRTCKLYKKIYDLQYFR